jgi:hypothetical protein
LAVVGSHRFVKVPNAISSVIPLSGVATLFANVEIPAPRRILVAVCLVDLL